MLFQLEPLFLSLYPYIWALYDDDQVGGGHPNSWRASFRRRRTAARAWLKGECSTSSVEVKGTVQAMKVDGSLVALGTDEGVVHVYNCRDARDGDAAIWSKSVSADVGEHASNPGLWISALDLDGGVLAVGTLMGALVVYQLPDGPPPHPRSQSQTSEWAG